MKKPLAPSLLAMSLLIFSSTAQAVPKETPPQLPLYQVEIIVFETTALRGWTEEYWPHQVPEVPTEEAYPIQPGVVLEIPLEDSPTPFEPENNNYQVQVIGLQSETLQAEPLEGEGAENEPMSESTNELERTAETVENRTQAFLLMPDEKPVKQLPNPIAKNKPLWLLNTEANKLVPRKGYRILIHQSWVQLGLPPQQAQPIYFENSPQSKYRSALTGTVKLYKTRYAHIETHFNLERLIPNRIREKFALHEDLTEDQLPDHWTFKLQQARKIKPGQLHYIDHPTFGILVQIKRLKPEQRPYYQAHALSTTKQMQ